MDKNYGMDLLRATEITALTAYRHLGSGNAPSALNETREAMVKTLMRLPLQTTVVGDRFQGKEGFFQFPNHLGSGKEETDLMAIAFEGYKSGTIGKGHSACYAALTPPNGLARLPNIPMEILVAPSASVGVMDLDLPFSTNIKRVARALGRRAENLTICILEQEGQETLIEEIRSTKASLKLIPGGEIQAALSVILEEGSHLFYGKGFAPEGVMIAAAIGCLGGHMLGRLIPKTKEDHTQLSLFPSLAEGQVFHAKDLAPGPEIFFAGSGIATGHFLKGVEIEENGAKTYSFLTRAKTGTQPGSIVSWISWTPCSTRGMWWSFASKLC